MGAESTQTSRSHNFVSAARSARLLVFPTEESSVVFGGNPALISAMID